MDHSRSVLRELVMAVLSDDHNAAAGEAAAREIVSGVGSVGGTVALGDLAVELTLKLAESVERIAADQGLAAADITDILLVD